MLNFCKGLHTNSSSSHCIVLSNKEPKGLEEYTLSDFDEYIEFGWEYFILKESSAKASYIFLQLKSNGLLDKFLSLPEVQNLIKTKPEIKKALDLARHSESYIDHQSILNIPTTLHDNIEFLKDFFLSIIVCPEYKIIGGNDNSSSSDVDYFLHSDSKIVIHTETLSGDVLKRMYGWEIRKRHWWEKNLTSTTIIRIPKFDLVKQGFYSPDEILRHTYQNTEVIDPPSVVDLKITDFCEYECDFCYQKSSKNGKHCSIDTISKIKNVFDKLDIFQVALGGGDATKHPQIRYILDSLSEVTIVNITAKTIKDVLHLVPHINGGIGISITSERDVQTLKDELEMFKLLSDSKEYWKLLGKLVVHIIPKLIPKNEMEKIISSLLDCKITSVLFLGFKKPRVPVKTYRYSIMKFIEKLTNCNIEVYIDTCLVRNILQRLRKLDSDSWYYTNPFTVYTHEGYFSKYIDAVNNFVSPSSYETHLRQNFNDDQELQYALLYNFQTLT